MGNEFSSVTTSTAVAGIDSYVSELSDVQYEKSLGSARFLKTIRGRHKEGSVVVKIFIKPSENYSLQAYMKRIEAEQILLAEAPNACEYRRILETEKAAYMIRAYHYTNLYDRLSIRPFLTLIEKKWIAFQLLNAVSDAHVRGICHGDIKTENVLVTSWNWVYLTDFAGFKPTYLPADNPADFSFFFDTSQRRTCYLAPERFYEPGDKNSIDNGELTPEMDIFSLGCVIAELFLEGTPIFSLSQLFKYRSGEYDPTQEIDKIEDEPIAQIVKHMIQLDPSSRYTTDKYLTEWRGTAFPPYFYTFLYQYMCSLTDTHGSFVTPRNSNSDGNLGEDPINNGAGLNTEPDERIEKIYYDFDKIAYHFGISGSDEEEVNGSEKPPGESPHQHSVASSVLLPSSISIANYESILYEKKKRKYPDDGALIFLSLICSLIRNTAYPSARLSALDLLLAIGQHLPDDVKLDRIVPYVISLLSDEAALVRASAVKTLARLLSMVESITPSNATIFPEYIFPNLRTFATDPELFVRVTYAACIAPIAETAMRFLEMAQALKSEGLLTLADPDSEVEGHSIEATYDAMVHDLLETIEEQVITLLIDPESAVKRVLLTNVAYLCIFFGRQKANDVLLSHMITFLNDRDWALRCAFFESIVGVGTFVGGRSLEEYILPLTIQALTDSEEFVVEKVLASLTSLAELGLFQKIKLWELVGIVAPLLCHPNIWIRYWVIAFIASVSKLVPATDVWCIIYPLVTPFLRTDIVEISELKLLESVKEPLSRQVFEQAIIWASKATSESLFWRNAIQRKSSFSAKEPPSGLLMTAQQKRASMVGSSAEGYQLSEEDEQYLDRLRTVGMQKDDIEKLAALREYIYKLSRMKLGPRSRGRDEEARHTAKNGVIALKNLNVTPHTVFLYPPYSAEASTPSISVSNASGNPLQSIAAGAVEEVLVPKKQEPHPADRVASLGGDRHRKITTGRGPEPTQSPDADAERLLAVRYGVTSSSADNLSTLSATPPLAARSGDIELLRSSGSEPTLSGVRIPNLPVSGEGPSSSLATARSLPASSLHKKSSRTSLIGPSSNHPSTTSGNNNHSQTKAAAETRTSTAIALGTVVARRNSFAGSTTSRSSVEMPATNATTSRSGRAEDLRMGLSTYSGTDKNLKRLLEKKAMEAFPEPMPEFGPKIPASARRRLMKGAVPLRPLEAMRPQGVLVAHLAEHRAAITQIAIAPDHAFFATASDDGTIKIWDSARLEKNATSRSRLTYNLQGGRVTCMTFIENTHTIAAAAKSGVVHLFKVEYLVSSSSGTAKYGRCQPMRKYMLEDGEHAVYMSHYTTESESILLIATSTSRIQAVDLRTMQLAWSLRNPLSHGDITALVTDPKHTWMLVGTARGLLTLWDLRFRIALCSWMHPSRSRIHRLALWPGGGSGGSGGGKRTATVLVASGRNEIAVWDVEHGECREVFMVLRDNTASPSGIKPEAFKPLPVSSDAEILRHAFTPRDISPSTSEAVRALALKEDRFLITAGSDRKIRFWDLARAEASFVVSGLDLDDPRPKHGAKNVGGLLVRYEVPAGRSADAKGPFVGGGNRARHSRTGSGGGGSGGGGSSGGQRTPSMMARQQQLLRNHLDAIVDLQLLEVPYPMIVSGDREGVVRVFA
ncbi:uncharacterized protein VTP21DRAFT_10761 [Calcarisporiella thermophila]|uniref:uncharacterized protein n=1 Tax=Calcarisporiella thermophila TaxID=911321 RepID=UPI003744A344